MDKHHHSMEQTGLTTLRWTIQSEFKTADRKPTHAHLWPSVELS